MTQHIGTQMSLFDRLGGAPAITAAAELFCNQVLADPLLAPYFDDDDIDRQVAKQATFLVMSPGGPYRRSRRTSSCRPSSPAERETRPRAASYGSRAGDGDEYERGGGDAGGDE